MNTRPRQGFTWFTLRGALSTTTAGLTSFLAARSGGIWHRAARAGRLSPAHGTDCPRGATVRCQPHHHGQEPDESWPEVVETGHRPPAGPRGGFHDCLQQRAAAGAHQNGSEAPCLSLTPREQRKLSTRRSGSWPKPVQTRYPPTRRSNARPPRLCSGRWPVTPVIDASPGHQRRTYPVPERMSRWSFLPARSEHERPLCRPLPMSSPPEWSN